MSNFGKMKSILIKEPLKLDCGKEISNFPSGYFEILSLNFFIAFLAPLLMPKADSFADNLIIFFFLLKKDLPGL